MQAALFPIAVHCFFGWCAHVVRELDPQAAHDVMECHYRASHTQDIEQLIRPYIDADRLVASWNLAVQR
jgi:hypothetical protein